MTHQHKCHYKTVVNAPVQKVWEGLTNPALVKEYFYGSNLITDWKIGSPIFFQGEFEGKSYKDKGIVKEYIEHKFLTYTYLSDWSGLPDTPENYLDISYSVKPVDGGTELEINQTNYDAKSVKHSEENWAVVIAGLKKLIEKP